MCAEWKVLTGRFRIGVDDRDLRQSQLQLSRRVAGVVGNTYTSSDARTRIWDESRGGRLKATTSAVVVSESRYLWSRASFICPAAADAAVAAAAEGSAAASPQHINWMLHSAQVAYAVPACECHRCCCCSRAWSAVSLNTWTKSIYCRRSVHSRPTQALTNVVNCRCIAFTVCDKTLSAKIRNDISLIVADVQATVIRYESRAVDVRIELIL